MIIVTVSMMKNEEVFAESSVRYWLTFSDTVIIFNHYSTDGTQDILEALQKEFPYRIILFKPKNDANFEYDQAEITNDMVREAFEKYNADLVMPLDADEFPYVVKRTDGSLREILASLNQEVCYRTFWMPFASADDKICKKEFAPLAFTKRRKVPFQRFPKCIISGKEYRRDPVFVTMGNHGLRRSPGKDNPTVVDISPLLLYAHYMYRDEAHYRYKVAAGWIANYARKDWKQGEAIHYQFAVQKVLCGAVDKKLVDWAALTCQGMENDGSACEIEVVDPRTIFPDIPLVYTEKYCKNKDEFIQLFELCLALVNEYKQLQSLKK